VDDLTRGIFLAATREVKSGAVYFIAERTGYSLDDLMTTMVEASGRSTLPIIIPAFLFRMIAGISEGLFKLVGATPMLTREKTRELLASWEMSTDRAREELGFESAIPLAQGVEQTYEWYRQHGWL
jgi:nucleoside-diphosphate-sugar epimerase